jgi:hypothetical protein
MTRPPLPDPASLAHRFLADLDALPAPSTQPVRALRREYSRSLKDAGSGFVWEVALALLPELRRGTPQRAGLRWVVCELIANHRAAFASLDAGRLEALGAGMQSWDEVDAFARILSGPAWLHGLIGDATVHAWARSPDLWWRRAAVVSTVALNMRSQGGTGDPARTLAVCDMLAGDREIMVQKALSWALRELVVHDAVAVSRFLDAHADLSALVKREVRRKLATGRKNPPRGAAVKT